MDTKKNGIMKGSKKELAIQRQDKFKSNIIQGSKKHRISFIDEIDQKHSLVQVHEVESWKSYNMESPNQETKQTCGCTII
ncbi:unnamed protein product (macronuclear) [Paramecium tetraurelia]|uniref:Guanine nucleotide-binding protein subunit gamma n=1 Tax=Paramecium tetraurelia TaxID=5888 RepID=A0DFA7_PARTE|nr:uncharacterized protein GSPATT00016537001 [Paramecium tetraurelia]CAK81724.1 unnamed protein product [Paramecium tetraurelia]|eukprot:XP_001449121.1 hypothetical protein (macronuclear) [Paramecium tetraurelia strain d4-2]